jgi:RNA 3'-terminal phosphate cyclase (ATP)
VFDAVLPLAYGLPDGLRLHATGGTHVRWAPTMDHQRRVKLPLVRDVGLDASVWVTRHGFYPAGGGDATLTVNPSTAGRVDLLDRGPLEGLELRSVATESLSDADVGARQADTLFEALQGVGVPIERTVEYVRADSPGSALLLVANYAGGRAGFSALGERGTAAERVAESVETAFEGFRRTRGVVDEHTADQLMIPLAVGGGSLTVPRVTDHVSSNAAVVRAFGGDVRVEGGEEGNPPRLVSPGGLV